ncbi:hypothetical protein FOA52_012029 [Chlamydomonas sp. UWO 241]|nr:hypothetical protein FOA52_012029 [Chlamydomonas sp. UWO 241]
MSLHIASKSASQSPRHFLSLGSKDGASYSPGTVLAHRSSVQPNGCHHFGSGSGSGVKELFNTRSSGSLHPRKHSSGFASDDASDVVDMSLFVGDLAPNADDTVLLQAFSAVGPIREARVMRDHNNRSKGYGFVSFFRREDAEAAVDTMQGQLIGSRRVRIGWAEHKKEYVPTPVESDAVERAGPANTNVHIGNLSPTMTDGNLRRVCSVYGPFKSAKLHTRGRYGFVDYMAHESALAAIVGLHTSMLNGTRIRCSWGKKGPDAALPLLMQELMLRQQANSGALGTGGADLAAALAGMLSAPRVPRQQLLPPAMPPYMQHGAVAPEVARQHAAMMAATAWQRQVAPQHMLYAAQPPHPMRGKPPQQQGTGQQQQQQSASELKMLTSRLGHLLLAQQQQQQQPYVAHSGPRQGFPAPAAADAEHPSQVQQQLDPLVLQMLMTMYVQGA